MADCGAYDVFLSYAHSDRAAAAELNGWLAVQGVSTFFDRNKLRPGIPWMTALEEAIATSKAAAILIGPHGLGNTQQYEREFALVQQARSPDRSFPVIPVLMPGCDSPPTGFLELQTWVEFAKETGVLQQAQVLEMLRAAVRGEDIAPSDIRATICPYRGLEPFREEDKEFYCGREGASAELAARVREHSFVAVIGASGSGKSSLVFAGLLPELRKDRSVMWDVVTIRPGKWPLRSLAEAFGVAPQDKGPAAIHNYFEDEVKAYRAGESTMLAGIVDSRLNAASEKPDRLLIYVDQWEELYAMAPAPEENKKDAEQHAKDVDKFIALLLAATAGKGARAKVVLTVRADFYAHLIGNRATSALLPAAQVNIPAMTPEDFHAVIETPATKAGLTFDPPSLIAQILNDVGAQEGRLPLLQFALKGIWEKRNGNRLTGDAFAAIGGVDAAIQNAAQAAYNGLSEVQQHAARRLFMSLVTPGEGQEDTRARGLMPEDPRQREIVELFANPKSRLLVTGFVRQQSAGREGDARATVEVAHEALIRGWKTLRDWVDANREKLRSRASIVSAMKEWDNKARSEDYLLPAGVQLERGRDLVNDPGDVPIDDIHDYVGRSAKKEMDRLAAETETALANERRISEAERREREAAEKAAGEAKARAAMEADLRVTAEQKGEVEQKARNDAETAAGNLRRYARKLRTALFAAVVAAATAVVAFGMALWQTNIAKEQTKETQRQLDRANRALAESINNDLGLEADKPLTSRQRDALWKLAAAADPVKSEFVSILAKSPNETNRASPGFAQISRALGLLRPSAAEAESLVAAVVGGLQSTNETRNTASLVEEFKALTPRITEAQAGQALDPLLKQIGQTTYPFALQALAQGSLVAWRRVGRHSPFGFVIMRGE
jgi:energy-coupling factor transporter ATP-binding protein EcfA2